MQLLIDDICIRRVELQQSVKMEKPLFRQHGKSDSGFCGTCSDHFCRWNMYPICFVQKNGDFAGGIFLKKRIGRTQNTCQADVGCRDLDLSAIHGDGDFKMDRYPGSLSSVGFHEHAPRRSFIVLPEASPCFPLIAIFFSYYCNPLMSIK